MPNDDFLKEIENSQQNSEGTDMPAEKPKVRMKWGRIIEEPESEPAEPIVEVPASSAEEPKAQSKVPAAESTIQKPEPEETAVLFPPQKPKPTSGSELSRPPADAGNRQQSESRSRGKEKTPGTSSDEGRKSDLRNAQASPKPQSALPTKNTEKNSPATSSRKPLPQKKQGTPTQSPSGKREEKREEKREKRNSASPEKRETAVSRVQKREKQPSRVLPILKQIGMGILSLLLSIRLPKIRLSKKQVLTLFTVLCITLLTAVLLGNFLLQKVGSEAPGGEETDSGTEAETFLPIGNRGKEVPDLAAGAILMKGLTTSTLAGTADELREKGSREVSLLVRDTDGTLFYTSDAAEEIGLSASAEGALSITDAIGILKKKQFYVSVCFPICYAKDGNEMTYPIYYAYETALLSELALSGADEVILTGTDTLLLSGSDDDISASDMSGSDIAELIQIASAINEKSPDTLVGIALSPDFLATKKSDRYLGDLARAFDLVLLDLTSVSDETSAGGLYETVYSVLGDHYYFILRYSMRILIPGGQAEAVLNRTLPSWQEGTLAPLPKDPESNTE